MQNHNQCHVMLITGTSRGIGNHLALYYLSKGWNVIGCSRGGSTIEHQAYVHIKCNLSEEADILNLFKEVRQKYNCLDVLINNAAINPAIVSSALLPYSTIESTFRVNVFATMLMCRESIKLMVRRKFGRIVNLGSMASKLEVPGEAVYTATKAALIGYTRVLAKEVSGLGITANILAPSIVETELSAKIRREAIEEILIRNAISTYGTFFDITNLMDLLIDVKSSAITGQVIYLGGV